MIPKTIDINGIWDALPPGIHDATLEEVEKRFATTIHRQILFDKFKKGVESLRSVGCKTIYLDGSYVTDKTVPGDFDACWDPTGVNFVELKKKDPVLLDFSNMRQNQKQKYGGEFFLSSAKADATKIFLDYFQEDKASGKPKGIIRIKLL